jgi:hypothetical protein
MTVSALIARYRQADERARLDGGDDSAPCSLDPTRVWSVAEFAEVVAAAEMGGEMEALLRAPNRELHSPGCAPVHADCRPHWERTLADLLTRLDAVKGKGG